MIKIPLAPFGGNLRVFTSVSKFRAYVSRYAVDELTDEEVENVVGFTMVSETKRGAGLFMMLLPAKQDLSTLVHESSHVTDYLLEHHCIPVGIENTEQRAYTVEYFFREISKALYGVKL